jgi:putative hydrolase of HD superfamily
MDENLKQQLAFIVEIDKMKSVYRLSLLMDKSRRETDAEHSWHFAMAAMLFAEYADDSVDINRVIKMALVHDLVEIYAGDTPAYDTVGYMDKPQRETAAADKLFSMLPSAQAQELYGLWREFEEMETADAKYAAGLDRFMPLLSNYMTDGHTWAQNHVHEDQIYKRMGIIETAIPKLWPYVQQVINESVEKGHVIRDALS